MSEKLLVPPPEMKEKLLEAEAHPDTPEQARENAEKHEDNQTDRIQEIQSSLKELATSSQETKDATAAAGAQPAQQLYADKNTRAATVEKEFKTIRAHLSKREQALSKGIHNEAVQKVSAIGEKTIARPQALLWGGLFAALSSAALYLTAKYIGFQYNYLISIMCFIGGYVVGLIVELILRVVRPAKTV